MRYNNGETLRSHARIVSGGVAAHQSQESLDEQLKDLLTLATRFGLYDAADWVGAQIAHRQHYFNDFGEQVEGTDRYDPARC
jgi:lysozyme family protein